METLNNRAFYKKTLSIALPIAAQSLIGSSLSLIDNLMVGTLGETELAAVGAGVQIFFLYWMVIFGFNSGGAMFVAQFWGARDLANIKKTLGFMAKVSFCVALVFFIGSNLFAEYIMKVFSTDPTVIALGVRYIRFGSPCFLFIGMTQPMVVGLRCTQQPKIPLAISTIAFVTNTLLNLVLIFGFLGLPRLETDGAALATSIARLVELSLVIFMIFGRKNIISGKLSEYRHAGRNLALGIVKRAVPTTINETLWGLGQTMYMSAIGHIGVTAYAAAQASNTIQNVFIMAGFSIGDAALIIIGEKLGVEGIDEAKEMAKKFVGITIVVGVIAGILMVFLSGPVIGWFDFTDTGSDYAKKILLIYGIPLPLDLYNGVLISGILRSGGDTPFAATTEVCTVWLYGVPLAFLGALYWHLPVYLVILLVRTEDIVKGVILTVRLISGKWAKNIINNL